MAVTNRTRKTSNLGDIIQAYADLWVLFIRNSAITVLSYQTTTMDGYNTAKLTTGDATNTTVYSWQYLGCPAGQKVSPLAMLSSPGWAVSRVERNATVPARNFPESFRTHVCQLKRAIINDWSYGVAADFLADSVVAGPSGNDTFYTYHWLITYVGGTLIDGGTYNNHVPAVGVQEGPDNASPPVCYVGTSAGAPGLQDLTTMQDLMTRMAVAQESVDSKITVLSGEVASLREPIQSIAEQDLDIALNNGAAVFSVRSKVNGGT